ncbi:MAG: CRISPR system precrRNA processing endoribonuclease RAMP protein Cas6 [Thiohalocapsa sp.]|nr:CRISPR system precrRNA processing endoribonuclease RAMP protein Cas6 [Thiohalocapsa sp.]
MLQQSCVYSTLFETPATPQSGGRGARTLPHPFVLDIDPTLPRTLAPGMDYPLAIHLFGAAVGQAPYLIHAFNVAGRRGIGKTRGRFSVARVEHERTPGNGDWQAVYEQRSGTYTGCAPAPLLPPSAPAAVRLRLITPLRLKRDGHFVGARELTAADLVKTLYRRLRALGELQDRNCDAFDPRNAGAVAERVQLHADWLRWYEWTRYSSRQDTLMQFGGLIGELSLAGPGVAELWPALWLGQWTHIGKGTAFGLGGYRVGEDQAMQA